MIHEAMHLWQGNLLQFWILMVKGEKATLLLLEYFATNFLAVLKLYLLNLWIFEIINARTI